MDEINYSQKFLKLYFFNIFKLNIFNIYIYLFKGFLKFNR